MNNIDKMKQCLEWFINEDETNRTEDNRYWLNGLCLAIDCLNRQLINENKPTKFKELRRDITDIIGEPEDFA